jgi:hypothetical protein
VQPAEKPERLEAEELEPREPEAVVEPEPEAAPEPAADGEAEGFLYFVPRAGEGYELVEQPGSAPAVGDTVQFDGRSFEVRRHSRSPLPFDRRVCVYLRLS